MGAGLEEITRYREVRRGRRDHADRFDRAQQLPMIGERSRADLRRDGFAGLLSGIDDTHQVALRRLGVLLRMEPSQVPDADHRCLDFPHSPSL